MLQMAMLSNVVESEYTAWFGNAHGLIEEADSYSSAVWTSVIVQNAQDKGVLTSLINAGLMWHEHTGDDSLVGLTDAGFDVMREFYNK